MIEFKKTSDLDVFLIFRWLVLLSIILIAGYTTEDLSSISLIYIVSFLYFVFNLTLRLWKPHILKKQVTLFSLFLFDIGVVSTIFYLTGGISSDYYIFYFLTIMMASISSGLGAALAITIASAGIYVWLVQQQEGIDLQNPVFLLKVVFLLLTAFISSLWNKIMREKVENVKKTEEQKKKELQQFFQEIINSINSGIAVFEKEEGDLKVHLINPKAQELTMGNNEILSILKQKVRENGKTGIRNQLIKTKNGRYWGVNGAVLRDLKGKKKGEVIIFNEITERKKMEKEMERSKRINRLGRLTLQIAHDLRNPLGTVSGLAQIIRMSAEEDKEKKYAKEILKASNVINELIEDMLDFSKDQELNFDNFNYLSFLKEILDNFQKAENLKEKNVQIKLNSGKGSYEIKADKEKLRRVFSNLINNACDALDRDGEININLRQQNNSIITEVIDNGSGIPESKREEIFEPFVTSKKNGTGLGLSIVQRIVSSHNGNVFVESKEGEGTEFTVVLPKKGGKNG